jgi:hypothetical protein
MTRNMTPSSWLGVVKNPVRKKSREKLSVRLVRMEILMLSRRSSTAMSRLYRVRISPTLASIRLFRKKFQLPSRIPAKKLVIRIISKILDSSVCALEK